MNSSPEVIGVINALLSGMLETLPGNLVGLYLRGSIATGDFDPATSDIDFFAITERPLSAAEFAALSALHAHIAKRWEAYGDQLEGPYIHREAARRFRPGERHTTIGRGAALEWSKHSENWVLERWFVREHGITLYGPDPATLIDPVSTAELREAVRARLVDWAEWADDVGDPEWQLHRGHKAYVVETMCRALYTLAQGELPSKPQAVTWALATLPEPWRATVERSRAWRDDRALDSSLIPEVRRFVQYAASVAVLAGS